MIRARALDGGADGLDFYRRWRRKPKPFLKPDGKIMLEFGDGQAEAIQKIFEAEKWIVEAVKEDYSQRARILIAKSLLVVVLVIVIGKDRRTRTSTRNESKFTWKVF